MSEDTQAPRGDAAWKAQRAAIAQRNAETRKQGQAEKRSRDREVNARDRAEAVRETHELDVLNKQLDKQRGRS